MAILFPPELDQHLHLGASEEAFDNTIETKVLVGPPIILEKSRSQHRPISGRLLLRTNAQLEIFQDWFLNTLGSGRKRFQWHRPGISETLEMQFTGQKFSISGDLAVGYHIELSLMIVRRIA